MFREVNPSLFNIDVECDIKNRLRLGKKVGEEVNKSTRDDVGEALLVSATFRLQLVVSWRTLGQLTILNELGIKRTDAVSSLDTALARLEGHLGENVRFPDRCARARTVGAFWSDKDSEFSQLEKWLRLSNFTPSHVLI
jgi:hypothetical protein